MAETSNLFLNLSALYRNTQKYYDRALAKYDIGSGQLIVLQAVHENDGITMQEVTKIYEVDKGTTTSSVNRLIEQGYITSKQDEHDRRIKHLYSTEKAAEIMNEIYECRMQCRSALAEGVDFDAFEETLEKVRENAKTRLPQAEESSYDSIRIGGIQKVTLLDYPGLTACTIFTAGCTFKCPYCHNKDLVYIPENYTYIDPNEVMEYLEKRKGLLDGVCISGGEPLIQEDLIPFIQRIKSLGLKVKLDTNGNEPETLKKICEAGLVDYVAMDVKNSKEKYAETVGLNKEIFNLSHIEECIQYLNTSKIEHEFRTTVVKELHTKEDLIKIAEWIKPCKKYYLQQFQDSGNLIQEGFTAFNKEEMEEILTEVNKIIPTAELRGVKEN